MRSVDRHQRCKDRVFCSGANIFMLGLSSARLEGELLQVHQRDAQRHRGLSSQHSGLKFVAALNGACAGGGYELALACDEIVLVDDRSSSVSLPEVPLLGVLPGTGGLTRVTDKRHVRHDLADIFCTTTEGVRGQRAVRLAAASMRRSSRRSSAPRCRSARQALAAASDRPADAKGVALPRIERAGRADALRYEHVTVQIDRAQRTATFTVKAPRRPQPTDIAGIEAAGAALVAAGDGAPARRRHPASMRTNELDIGTWLLKTEGDAAAVLACDAHAARRTATTGSCARPIGTAAPHAARAWTCRRARLFALIEPGSCFAGTLAELAFAADRAYMLALPDDAARAPRLSSARSNFGACPMVNDQPRLIRRFYDEAAAAARGARGDRQGARRRRRTARSASSPPRPTTSTGPTRSASRSKSASAMSPDALTGLEANLRFARPGEHGHAASSAA